MHLAETLSHASPRLPGEGKNPADKLCSQQHREQQTSIEKETKQKQMALIGDHFKNNAWQQLKKNSEGVKLYVRRIMLAFKTCSKRTKSNNNNVFFKKTAEYVCVCSVCIKSLSRELSLIMDHMER